MKKSFVFSGSGGQGVMSAGITLAEAAVSMGKHATYLPEYGPEQRGGSAKCTVVVSDDEIISPLPLQTDNLIVLTEQAYEKFCDDVKPGGIMLANAGRIKEMGEHNDVKVISVDVDSMAHTLGNMKSANIILMGILIGATDVVSRECFVSSLEEKFKSKKPEILEMNIKALDMGIQIGIENRQE